MPRSEEENQEERDFNVDMFATDELDDDSENLEKELLEQFPDYSKGQEEEEEEEGDPNNEEEEEEEDEDPNKLNFDDEDKSKKKDEDDDEFDLAALNKKFDKNFQSEQEFKDFLKGKEDTDTVDKDEVELTAAENQLSFLNPLLELTPNGGYKVDDETLMRKQFESIAVQNKKDLNDEDVQIDIEEQIQTLLDKGVLNLQADNLREKIKNIVRENTQVKNSILQKRTEAKLAEEKITKENLQNEFAAFHSMEDFYGVKLDKTIVEKAYKNAISGKFIESLQTDKKAMAEFSIMAEIKEALFKKATGRTYSDGIKTVVDEFKARPKNDKGITKAQTRGTAASAEGSKGLIDSILFEKPKEKDKK